MIACAVRCCLIARLYIFFNPEFGFQDVLLHILLTLGLGFLFSVRFISRRKKWHDLETERTKHDLLEKYFYNSNGFPSSSIENPNASVFCQNGKSEKRGINAEVGPRSRGKAVGGNLLGINNYSASGSEAFCLETAGSSQLSKSSTGPEFAFYK